MKTRIYLLLMLAALIVPVACLTLLGLSRLLDAEREARLHAIREMVNATSLLIDSEIAVAEAALRTVAYSDDVRAGRLDRVHQLLAATATSPLSWAAIADYEGNGLLNTLAPYGTPLARRTGSWAAAIYDGQKTVVSGYFLGSHSKRAVVSVNVPVPLSSGKRYVVYQVFDPAFFNKTFRGNLLQDGWVIGLFDANGISIARNISAAKYVGSPVRPELYQASRSQASGLLRHITRDGRDVYDTFVRSSRTGWTVAIGVPASQIESAARMATLFTALAILAVLGGAVGVALYFGRRVDRAIQRATRTAQAQARGRIRQTERHSAAKDQFLAMLGHELRNPLAAINSAVTLLELTDAPPSARPKVWQVVVRQLGHLGAMVDQLLDVNRLASGKVVLSREALALEAVLQSCCEVRMLASGNAHTWELRLEPVQVWADQVRLEQVLDNLLINAVKYTPAGGAITVCCHRAGSDAIVEIADSGAGIAPEVLPGIFDALVQGPTTLDRSQGGLGLGLSIVRGLVRMHGGDITAHSAGLGQGSRFTLRLPIGEAAAGGPAAGDPAAGGPAA